MSDIGTPENVIPITKATKLQKVYDQNFNREGETAIKPIFFSEIDRRARSDTVSQLGNAIQKERTREALDEARTDPLTGLRNRLGFEDSLTMAIDNTKKFGHPSSLAMGDVNNLKPTNDEKGYEFGDKLLINAGEGLSQGDKKNTSRWGGDEFGRVFKNQTEEQAAVVLREEVAPDLDRRGVEMGIAVIQIDGSNEQNKKETLRLANKVLKIAKKRSKAAGKVIVLRPADLTNQEILEVESTNTQQPQAAIEPADELESVA